jgi:hypothetical protein
MFQGYVREEKEIIEVYPDPSTGPEQTGWTNYVSSPGLPTPVKTEYCSRTHLQEEVEH